MEEVRANVKDVEVRCKAIHAAAARVGIRLDRVAISEERTVNVCSHAEHQPSVSTRWRIEMEPCRVTERMALVKIKASRTSSTSSATLDGVTAQAVGVFNDMAPTSAPDAPGLDAIIKTAEHLAALGASDQDEDAKS